MSSLTPLVVMSRGYPGDQRRGCESQRQRRAGGADARLMLADRQSKACLGTQSHRSLSNPPVSGGVPGTLQSVNAMKASKRSSEL
eukprot:2233991-Rhodomonas_salina.1